MQRLALIGNLLGFACVAATLVLSLPGIHAVRADESAASSTPVAVVDAPASDEATGVASNDAAPVCGPRASTVETPAPPPGPAAPAPVAEYVDLNRSGYNY